MVAGPRAPVEYDDASGDSCFLVDDQVMSPADELSAFEPIIVGTLTYHRLPLVSQDLGCFCIARLSALGNASGASHCRPVQKGSQAQLRCSSGSTLEKSIRLHEKTGRYPLCILVFIEKNLCLGGETPFHQRSRCGQLLRIVH